MSYSRRASRDLEGFAERDERARGVGVAVRVDLREGHVGPDRREEPPHQLPPVVHLAVEGWVLGRAVSGGWGRTRPPFCACHSPGPGGVISEFFIGDITGRVAPVPKT